MPTTRIRLKPGLGPTQALAQLEPLIEGGRNLTAVAVGVSSGEVTTRLQQEYLGWVERIETVLGSLSYDNTLTDSVFTERYWHIRSMQPDEPRPFPLVDHESERQRQYLQALVDDLKARMSRAGLADGVPVVLDTNVLLHFLPPAQIPWTEVLGLAEIRLILPLRVIEELDAKKYGSSSRLAQRARSILPMIEKAVGLSGQPGEIRDRVTLEVLIEPGTRIRPSDADEEILAVAVELPGLYGKPVTLVTGDTGTKLRARALDIPVAELAEDFQRDEKNER